MTRRLRLGVDLHTFDGIHQGSRSHLLGLYRAAILLAPDIDFVFLLAQPDRLRHAYAEFSRSHVQLVTMAQRPGPWRLVWQLAAMQRRHALDLLHVQFRMPVFPAGPCMCTVHDVLFDTHPQYFGAAFRGFARWSAGDALRRARIALTVSEYSRQQIARHYSIDVRRVILTPNAVDRQRFHPRAAGAPPAFETAILRRWHLVSQGYVCTLGRLEPRKNHATLLQAYARLPGNVPPLVIIGQRDSAYADIVRRIHAYGLEKRVHILEQVDDDALPVLLRHALLMAYPSLGEGFGMPLLEALASGVPVITSNVTALPEVAGGAAWRVAPDDVDALHDALRESLDEPSPARQARIERGLAHAAHFNWRESASQLVAAVRKAGLL